MPELKRFPQNLHSNMRSAANAVLFRLLDFMNGNYYLIRKYKQPYFISDATGCPLSFAGIWESATTNGINIESCSIITTESNKLMRSIHDRMPVILSPESFDTWVNPTALPNIVLEFFLKPYDSDLMQAWPVSAAVNKATIQGEQLIMY